MGKESERYRFAYGVGAELERAVREASGQVTPLESGPYGRIASRGGQAFSYDGAGRRLEDDRFVLRWDWRGQLVSVTVKSSWPDGEVSPYAGHQVRYSYDAVGRLTHRLHVGALPPGQTDDALRPFIDQRRYDWDGASLVVESSYGVEGTEPSLRWRKTYVPGPSGLDDAVQIVVEQGGQSRTYTPIRDELGSVVAIVAESESTDPQHPVIPVRYRYTPYGEAHVESGPELLRAHVDIDRQNAAGVQQTIADPRLAAPGALILEWSAALDPSSLAAGAIAERYTTSGWVAMPPSEAIVTLDSEASRLVVLPTTGWSASTSYRIRLLNTLHDTLTRVFSEPRTIELRTAPAPPSGTLDSPRFDQRYATDYASWQAATDTATNRFPGGQSSLFQGAWTDPVTGIAYHRARWYDARNAGWLSEDPVGPVDSANLYAFVGWGPQSGVDPLGLRDPTKEDLEVRAALEGRVRRFETAYTKRGVAGTTLVDTEAVSPRWWDPEYQELRTRPQSYLATNEATYNQLRGRLRGDLDTFNAAVAEADAGGAIEYSMGRFWTYTQKERDRDARIAAALNAVSLAYDLVAAWGARTASGGSLEVHARRGPRQPSRRQMYMGHTPGKASTVGREVFIRMFAEGRIREGANGYEVQGRDGMWAPVAKADMGHLEAAITYWNRVGRFTGARSPEVREFMKDPRNYELQPASQNRADGARFTETYLPPAEVVPKQ